MKNKSADFFITLIIMYIILGMFVLHIGYLMESQNLNNIKDFTDSSANQILENIIRTPFIFISTLINIKITFKIWVIYSVGFLGYGFYMYGEKNKYRRRGIEHGSAQWGTLKDAKILVQGEKSSIKYKNTENLRIISKNVKFKLGRKKLFINDNMIIFGSPGTGKTRNVIMPNILELSSNYVVTDTKGTILKNTGYFLKKNGYSIKVLNLVDMEHSNNFNPFYYIRKDSDILALIVNIQENITSGDAGKKSGDPFWEDAEKALLCSVFYFLHYEIPLEKRNFNKALNCILNFENPKSDYLIKIKELEKSKPEHLAYVYYKVVILSAEKTRQSILVTASVRLSQFSVEAIGDIVSTDDMELYKLDKVKTAIFVIIPDTTRAFNFIASMFFTTLFNITTYMADNKKTEMLDIPLQIYLDEFANIGKIPNFLNVLSVIRSRGISAIMILQNLSQLKEMYDKSWGTAIGNCDILLFLGGVEQDLLKYLSENFGKETIGRKNRSISKSKTNSTSYSENVLARSLITQDELALLDNKACIISIRSIRPIKDFKYELEKHKNYKYTRNANEKYSFYTSEKFFTKKAIIDKPKDEIIYEEITKEDIIKSLI